MKLKCQYPPEDEQYYNTAVELDVVQCRLQKVEGGSLPLKEGHLTTYYIK